MDKLKKFVECGVFQNAILALIILNSVTLGIETFSLSPDQEARLAVFNAVCTTIFVIEIALRIIVYKKDFVKSGWNIFDFIIVAVSLIPGSVCFSSARLLRILRIFRVFRVTRIIGHLDKLRKVIQAIFKSIPSIGGVLGILIIIIYIYAIVGTTLYSEISPEYFGDLWKSLYTLFQVMMLDDFGQITRPIIAYSTGAAFYFVSYITLAVLLVLNVIIGIVCDSIEEERENDERAAIRATTSNLDDELLKLEEQMNVIKHLIREEQKNRTGQ